MPAALALLPAAERVRPTVEDGHTTTLDVVHDHVLRVVGDHDVARRVVLDVLLRVGARVRETGEPATLPVLLRAARARLAPLAPDHLDAGHLRALVPADDPAGRAVATALATIGERAAALLDLTVRHGIDTRTAATALGIDPDHAATVRAEAMRHLRKELVALGGERVDVEATLAGMPVTPAPAALHDHLPDRGPTRIPPALAWLAPAGALAALAAALLLGLPSTLAASADREVPLITAEAVTNPVAVEQLQADGDGLPDGEGSVVLRPSSRDTQDEPETPDRAPADDDASEPTAGPTVEPTPEQTPDAGDEPADEPTADPAPEPDDGPLGELLPTGP